MKILKFSNIFIVIIFLILNTKIFAELNNPYYQQSGKNIYFSAFATPPKTLDPARSYYDDEILFISQIYEAPLQYDYLKRPYQVIPLTAEKMPIVTYYDQQGNLLADDSSLDFTKIAYTTYDIFLKPKIYFQPHPAFARNQQGQLIYMHLSANEIPNSYSLNDFKEKGTRELVAQDYIYQIKRLADPSVSSPIFGLMTRYLLGFDDFRQKLSQRYRELRQQGNYSGFIDLRKIPLLCCHAVNRYHYQIRIKGFYPQFKYWLTMPFFSPMPWEAVKFYAQPGMAEHNISLDEFPVGTGPYMMQKNNPNSEIDLVKNPNFHAEYYPNQGSEIDQRNGYLQLAGKKMPFINEFRFSLEKESIPRWQKFLQGYYDRSPITPEGFDQAIEFTPQGKPMLTAAMKNKGIYLNTTPGISDFYTGFNMFDPVVGGYSENKQKLRQAIAIAIDNEEYISIFLNGRGIPAQGPIPPGIFGYQRGLKGLNPYLYDWVNGKPHRKSIAFAKKLLAEAGYPNGQDQKTGKQLVLNYDVPSTGGPDEFAEFNWMRKQFAKLGIALNVRATLPNRFQDKLLSGDVQIFSAGWNADYPDPENFLFLFYSPNGMVKHNGENTSNYENPKVDQLFLQMADLPDGGERQQKINQITAILQKDSPWVWGFHPINFILSQQWLTPVKPSAVANNILKYYQLNPGRREQLLAKWNKPIIWPLLLVVIFIFISFIPLFVSYYLRLNRPSIKRHQICRDE